MLCSNDEKTYAEIFCKQCNNHFCEECFRVLHKSQSKSKHNFTQFKSKKKIFLKIIFSNCIMILKLGKQPLFKVSDFSTFVKDYETIERIRHYGPTLSLSKKRLEYLQCSWNLWNVCCQNLEKKIRKTSKTDFENAIKVDTHVHLGSMCTSVHFLDFIKRKLISSPDVTSNFIFLF